MVFVEGDVEIKACWAGTLDRWQMAGSPYAFKVTLTSAFFSTFEDHISSFIIKTKNLTVYIKIVCFTLRASLPSSAGDSCLTEMCIWLYVLYSHIHILKQAYIHINRLSGIYWIF